MPKTKRYFWLKLKEDFFNQKEIKLLRKIAGGDTYTIIYLKLLLLSLKNDGKIYFDGLTDEFSEEIALEIDESVENVQVTMQFLQSKGLIAFDSEHNDEFELTNIASMIGSETEDARRKRKQRQRESNSKGQIPDNVPNMSRLGHTELEKEKEKELEKETDKDKEKNNSRPRWMDTYENGGYGFLDPITMEKLFLWCDDFGNDGEAVIDKALEVGIESNIRTYKYVNGILKNWYNSKLLTVNEIEAHENKRQTQTKHSGGEVGVTHTKKGFKKRDPEEAERLRKRNEERMKKMLEGAADEIIT